MSQQSSQRSAGNDHTGSTKNPGVNYLDSDEASRKGSPLPSCADKGEGGENQSAHMDSGGNLYVESDEESESHRASDSNSLSAEDEKDVVISTLLSHSNMFEQSKLQKLRAERLHAEEKLLESVDNTK